MYCKNVLEFISANKYIKIFDKTQKIYLWKFFKMSEESIKNSPESGNFAQILINSYALSDVKLVGIYLTNRNPPVFRKIINLYISYNLTHDQEIKRQVSY